MVAYGMGLTCIPDLYANCICFVMFKLLCLWLVGVIPIVFGMKFIFVIDVFGFAWL